MKLLLVLVLLHFPLFFFAMHFLVFQGSSHGVPPQAVGAAKELIKIEIKTNLCLDLIQLVWWSKLVLHFLLREH